MNIVGLIVEYNPFHLGHSYHMKKAKDMTKADGVICIMSGNFIQRGEPAMFDKWARARMAILGGADLVIELPVIYAMSSAEYFAYAGVSLLNATGVTDSLCFGSEIGSINELQALAEILTNEPEEYRKLLKNHLAKGMSYPASREKALTEYFENTGCGLPDISAAISGANNILGIEYLKALIKTKSRIKPVTVRREGNNYNDSHLSVSFSSATSIREHIKVDGLSENIITAVPASTEAVMREEVEAGRGPVFIHDFDNVLLAVLRTLGKNGTEHLPYMSEGLHNRLYKGLSQASSVIELVDKCCTKRYTKTRISRGVFHSLTGLTEEDFGYFNSIGGPQYIRVLGLNQKGREMLSEMKKTAALPIIIKAADYSEALNEAGRKMLEIEAKATDMYVLGYKGANKGIGQEFTRNVVRIGL